MNNPFELINSRLENIETLLLDLKHNQPQQTEPAAPMLLTIREAADFLHLTVPTIYSKTSRGELPSMKRGKRLYFDRDELSDYIRAGRRMTNSEAESAAKSL